MLLSNLLNEKYFDINYQILADKNFETLGLIASNIDGQYCTFLDDEKYITEINENVTMLIVTKEVAQKLAKFTNYGLCISDEPRKLFFLLHNYLSTHNGYIRKSYNTVIGPNCNISNMSVISSKNVTIGKNVTIEEFVSIKENVIIGDNSTIRAGCIIGGEGFEFKRSDDKITPVKHLGGVIIGSDVEIQYNSCVDKAVYPWDNTIINDYVKIDNLVHIAHAVKINENTMVVANVGIGGRSEIGQNAWIGFGATVSNGLKVGNCSKISIGSVVTKNVDDNIRVTGNFAIDHDKFIKNLKENSK